MVLRICSLRGLDRTYCYSYSMASIVNFISNVLLRPVESYCSFGPTVSEITFGQLGYSFNPERDINDLSGKVVFVTGGMSSIYLGLSISVR